MNNFFDPDTYVETNETEPKNPRPPITSQDDREKSEEEEVMSQQISEKQPEFNSSLKNKFKRMASVSENNIAGLTLFKISQVLKNQSKVLQQIKRKENFNFIVHSKKYLFGQNSLFMFNEKSSFRIAIVWLVESLWFDRFITFVILLNTFFLFFQDYEFRITGVLRQGTMTDLLYYFDFVFAAIFFVEFTLKTIAMGFLFEPHTYLRNGWNIIDFLVVISTIVSLIGSINISAVRTVRILRPLRSINAIQGIRFLVGSLLDSLPILGNVLIFLIFILIVFGILGLQLFIGVFENRCRFSSSPALIWPADPTYKKLCVEDDDSTCPQGLFCRNPSSYNIPQQAGEIEFLDFNYGFTSFDNIFQATSTIFQALTTEGWSTQVYILQYTITPALVYIYYNLLIFLGSFFIINLILAVINQRFLDFNEKQIKEKIEEDKKIRQMKRQMKLRQDRQKEDPTGKLFTEDNEGDVVIPQKQQKQLETNPKKLLQIVPIQSEKEEMEDGEDEGENDGAKQIKQREELLLKVAIQTTAFYGRAQLLKKLEEQYNRHHQKKVNYFDPALVTINKEGNQDKSNPTNEHSLGKKIDLARKYLVEEIIEGNCFTLIITLFIIANTIVLSLDRYPQPTDEQAKLESANLAFTIFFLVEMVLKIIGYGFRNYFRDTLNIFDSLIVIVSLIEQILARLDQRGSNKSFSAIAAFRSLRLFRIFKLARSWSSFRKLLMAIATTISSIFNFIILLLIFIITTSLLGMELFAYKVRFNPDGSNASDLQKFNFLFYFRINSLSPRLNFDTFYNSVIIIFVLLTGESWNLITYQYMNGIGHWWPMIFFAIIVIMGNFILLKLFIAILLYNFGESTIEAQKKLDEQKKRAGFINLLDTLKRQLNDPNDLEDNAARDTEKQRSRRIKPIKEFHGSNTNSDAACFFQAKYDEKRFQQRKTLKSKKIMRRFFETAEVLDYDDVSDNSDDERILVENEMKNEMKRLEDKLKAAQRRNYAPSIFTHILRSRNDKGFDLQQEMENLVLVGRSLYLFRSQNKFRRIVFKLTTSRLFEYFIVLMIIISSILLALEDPIQNQPSQIVNLIDLIITIIFIFEAILKIISLGFILNGEFSYFRQMGNFLDFTVIAFSILSFFQDSSTNINFSTLKILRVFRVLRPLRLIARNEGLKIAINALAQAIPQILNVIVVCTIFFLLFGIFGVNQFKGQFYYCSADNLKYEFYQLIDNNRDCYDYGGSWINSDYNFDNILQAMVQLFVIATTEGWIDMMNQGADSRGINLQPKLNSRLYWQLFYVSFVIVGSFFVINLFVGIVVDAFNIEKDKLRGYFYLAIEQQEWIDIQYRIYESAPIIKPSIPRNIIRKKIFALINNKFFERFIFFLIILNTLLFMINYQRQTEEISLAILYGNIGFLSVFLTEVFLKIIALGKTFFLETFNNFDLGVLLLSVIGIVLEQTQIFKSIGTATSVLRMFRIIRVLRLIREAGSLRLIFNTFINSIPVLANIGALLSIILFIFSVLGMNLYSYLKRGQGGISDDANFSSFQTAFFTLFKCSTGEQWNLIMADSVRSQSAAYICYDVNNYLQYNAYGMSACGDWTGYLFHVIFQIFFSMIMLNLFVAVIMQGFDRSHKDEKLRIKLTDIEVFQETWKQFDKLGSGFIAANQFTQFMLLLPVPLGWQNSRLSTSDQRERTSEYQMPVYILNRAGTYFYYDVLRVIAHQYLNKEQKNTIELEPSKLSRAHRDLINIRKQKLKEFAEVELSDYTSMDIVAGQVLKKRLWWLVQERKKREAQALKRKDSESEDKNSEQEENKHKQEEEIDILLNLDDNIPKNGIQEPRKTARKQTQKPQVQEVKEEEENSI